MNYLLTLVDSLSENDRNRGVVLGFIPTIIHEVYIPSDNPVDILSFYIFSLETDIVHGLIFEGGRSGIFQNFTMDVYFQFKKLEKFRDEVHWYMMENKDFILNISFKTKNENANLVSFNDQTITFRSSTREV